MNKFIFNRQQLCKQNFWQQRQRQHYFLYKYNNDKKHFIKTYMPQLFMEQRSFYSFPARVLSFVLSFFKKQQKPAERNELKNKTKLPLQIQEGNKKVLRNTKLSLTKLSKPFKKQTTPFFEKYWSHDECEAAKAEGRAVTGVFCQRSVGGVSSVLTVPWIINVMLQRCYIFAYR